MHLIIDSLFANVVTMMEKYENNIAKCMIGTHLIRKIKKIYFTAR